MLKKLSSILIFLFIQLLLINSVLAGGVKYYSPEGNLITKEKYLELSNKVHKKNQEDKMAKIQTKLKETDEYGRPKFDYRNGEIVRLYYQEPETKSQSTNNIDSKTTHENYERRYNYPITRSGLSKRSQNTISYNDEKLEDERTLRKLQIMNERNKMESGYLPLPPLKSFDFENRRRKWQLDDIEQSTKRIENKLNFGW